MTSILHLKSGIAFLEDNTLVVMEEMADNPQFVGFDLLTVAANERVMEPIACRSMIACSSQRRVSAANGRPAAGGFKPLVLNMSEFQKMDGGLSCLSLRF